VAEYDSWEQVAGYFDADGTIVIFDLTYMPYKLCLYLSFVDQSIDQISMIRNFMLARGIKTSNVLKGYKVNAWSVVISGFDSVKKCLRCLIPHLGKKAIEAQATLDYYEGRITGNQLITIFEKEVEAGRREKRERKIAIDVPYTYPVGDVALKRLRAVRPKDALGRYSNKVTPEDFASIREAHFKDGKGVRELMKDYPQYGKTTIRRILSRGQLRR
jgi:hypothetical protein